jgi:peptidoglycan LD-endopeptidase LytH
MLIGFLAGAGATTYVLLHFGYLIGFERFSQTSQSSRQTPERIPQIPSQTQQNASADNQDPETMPQTETQTQLTMTLPNLTWSLADQEIPLVIPHPQDSSNFVADALVLTNHGAVRPIVSEPPAMMTAAVNELRQRHLLLPLRGLRKQDLVDSFSESRGNHVHEAIDILAPRNTPVLTVEDGSIARLWNSVPGGITIYQFDRERKFEYYYAHLERYADGLKDGDLVRRGQVIGYVGTSGNAPKYTPHLHFTIFKLPESKHWWEGTPVNPYLVFK